MIPDRLVILAAGGGSRLREHTNALPKPLTPVGGIPLIVRVLLGARSIGVRRVDVIVGFRREEIIQALTGTWRVEGLQLRFCDNPYWQTTSNGVSLLQAASDRSPFYLSMSDHLFDDDLWREAQRAASPPEGVTLLIDRKISQCFDLDDATKVKTQGLSIVSIGKEIQDYDALDCGLFVATSGAFDALREEQQLRGDCSLSDGMRRLAKQKRFWGHDVGAACWHDVDTQATLAHAEKYLASRGKVSVQLR